MPELVIYLYLSNLFSEVKHRAIISGMEADIYIPLLNLIVDYRGEYWHSGKDARERDSFKTTAFTNMGKRLIIIEENQENNTDTGNIIYYNRRSEYQFLIEMILTILNSMLGSQYVLDKNC